MNSECPICGNPKRKNRICCSRSCYAKFRQNYKICVICGKPFKCSPSSPQKTCSKECSSKWREQMYDDGVYDEAMKVFEERRDKYFATHKGELFHKAKYWVIQSPDGQVYECVNLLDFIREHPDLFDGTPKQAFDGFTKMKQTQKGLRKKGKTYQWKGWRLLDWKDENPNQSNRKGE